MTPPEKAVHTNGVTLATQAFGNATDPTVLLVSGAEATMDWWDEEFIARLGAAGRHVIRYDTRDTGRSTVFPIGEPPYTGDDLLLDALGVLDAHGVAAPMSSASPWAAHSRSVWPSCTPGASSR